MAKRRATSPAIKYEPNQLVAPLAEPTKLFYDGSALPHAVPETYRLNACSAPYLWSTATTSSFRLWPVQYPALYNPAFVVMPTHIADRTAIQIPPSSVLRPILKRERLHMDEAYMLLDHAIQNDASRRVLREIHYQLAHCLRHEFFLVTNPEPTSNLKDGRLGLQKAIWTKNEDVLHRRRYLELSFHALNSGIIMFPADPSPLRKYVLQSVLEMENSDEVRLKLKEIGRDDLEHRDALRSLRRNDLVGTSNTYVLLNATFRHPDRLDDKVKPPLG